MRDGRLERFCSTLCPGSLRMPGHFCVVRMRLLLEPGQKEQKPARFLCLREPKKAGQRNLRVALGAARPQCGRAAPGRAPTCAPRRRARKPPAAEARTARRASPFELRGRAQKVRFTPRYPLPSPAGETSFYPASAIKGAKPRPLSLS